MKQRSKLRRALCLPIVAFTALVILGGAATAAGATTTADVCGVTVSRPVLTLGSSGPAVAQLQCYLNHSLDPSVYPPLPVDGVFGPLTRSRLIVFQRCDGLPVTGTTDPATWAALKAVANSGTYLSC